MVVRGRQGPCNARPLPYPVIPGYKLTMRYIFIAYKPDSTDYCRNCEMARYSSDFVHESSDERSAFVKAAEDVIYKNLALDCGEVGYDQIFLYINGVLANENGGNTWWEDIPEETMQPLWDESNAIIEEASLLAKKRLEAAKTAAEAAKRAATEKAKEQRRKDYERLKQEFEA